MQNVTLEEGYFRISALSRDVVECPVRDACSPSSTTATTTAAAAATFRDFGDSLCAHDLGYEGPLCMVCRVSANVTYYFDGHTCVKCAGERDAGIVVLSMLVACVVLFAILYRTGASATIYRSIHPNPKP